MNYSLFFHDIDSDDNHSRAERERKAVDELVAGAFGPDAVKSRLPSGAPLITIGGLPVDRLYSISHCAGLAILAVAEGVKAVGTDIEIYREQLRRVASRFLSPEEEIFYSSDEGLLTAWTLKEAAYKAALTPGLALKDIRLPLAEGSKSIFAPGMELEIIESRFIKDAVRLAVVIRKH